MHNAATLLASMLLPLCHFASSVPVQVHSGSHKIDIWVTRSNTLKATMWSSTSHDRLAVATQLARLSDPTYEDNGTTRSTAILEDSNTRAQLANQTRLPVRLITNQSGTNGAQLSANNTWAGASTTGISTHLVKTNSSTSAVEAAAGTLPVMIDNNLPSSNVKVYISGLDANGTLVMLGQSGRWEYPTATSGDPVPIPSNVVLAQGPSNTTKTYTLPSYVDSARIWVVDGSLQFFVVATPSGPGLVQPAPANLNDPNAEANYAFAELSWSAQYGIYADITNVDFVGLPLGIQLRQSDNSVLSVLGTPADAATRLCSQLTQQSKVDGRPWDQLCEHRSDGSLVRVLAPSDYVASQSDAFGNYFSDYVDDVWNHYGQNDLFINTQSAPGIVTCQVRDNLLQCAGDNRGYAKPNAFDIFGCNTGPFAINAGDNAVHYAVVPRLCAAFNRATLLLPRGNVQPSLPPSSYYPNENRSANTTAKNWYSQLVHAMEQGGKGYAFSYDDVSPSDGDDQSGLVSSTNPRALSIIIGGT